MRPGAKAWVCFFRHGLRRRDDPTLFNGDVESYLLGDIVLSRPRANRQKFDRPSGRIARDGLDSYMIQLFVRGQTEIALGRRSVRGPERKIVGFDLGDTLDSQNDDFDILAVLVPRARLAPLLTHPDSLHTAIPSTESGGGGLLANFLPNLFDSLPDLALSQSESAGRALIELIATAFNGATFAEGDAPQIAHRALVLKAKSFVKARLASPALDPEQVAAAMGLSRSALYRLFKESGGIAYYIRGAKAAPLLRSISSVIRGPKRTRRSRRSLFAGASATPRFLAGSSRSALAAHRRKRALEPSLRSGKASARWMPAWATGGTRTGYPLLREFDDVVRKAIASESGHQSQCSKVGARRRPGDRHWPIFDGAGGEPCPIFAIGIIKGGGEPTPE